MLAASIAYFIESEFTINNLAQFPPIASSRAWRCGCIPPQLLHFHQSLHYCTKLYWVEVPPVDPGKLSYQLYFCLIFYLAETPFPFKYLPPGDGWFGGAVIGCVQIDVTKMLMICRSTQRIGEWLFLFWQRWRVIFFKISVGLKRSWIFKALQGF